MKLFVLHVLFYFTFLIKGFIARPDLIVEQDDRKLFEVAEFGFLQGGKLTLTVQDYKWTDIQTPGISAFYIRKGWILKDHQNRKESSPVIYDDCFLNNSFIADEVDDGVSTVKMLPNAISTRWTTTIDVMPGEQGLWQVLFISCKDTSVSFRLKVEEVNPGNNHLSAGDSPLPYVYGFSSLTYLLASAYWCHLLLFKKNTKRVFRAHWLMLVLVLCIVVNKALQSTKYHYMKLGVVSDGWKIGFYVFASIRGILSILIIILLASGWTFIKPFLSSKDKKIISIIIPLQVLANVASAIGSEAAIGSSDWTFWNVLLPFVDMAGCSVILWTILQTKKHLASASTVDGKEQDVLNKYKLWSSFYVVTLVYIYITRILVTLLQASLPYQYVTWAGEAVNEIATLAFYVFIGYKFRPFPNNPYIQVPNNDDEEEEEYENEPVILQSLNRRDPTSPSVHQNS
ncbi:hypothetical protein K501DRAFT_334567 [Backusella circina FSU 941]|nr:hypothetical protein K501DRAFT_334567 [Backusella circina FSU 941]